MSTATTFLTLILFTAVAVCGLLAVLMTVMTLYRPGKKPLRGAALPSTHEEVQVYFRNSLAKVEVNATKNAKSQSEEKVEEQKPVDVKIDLIEDKLAGLPSGYHILTDLELTLQKSVTYKGSKLKTGKINFLVIGPRRIYVLKSTSQARPNLQKLTTEADAGARLVSLFLSQKLEKEFRVCGWVVMNKNVSKTKYQTIVHRDDLKEAIIKYEKTSQGKSKLPTSESVPEIISVLKLAQWETREGNKLAKTDTPAYV